MKSCILRKTLNETTPARLAQDMRYSGMNVMLLVGILLLVAWVLLRVVFALTGLVFHLLWIAALVFFVLWLIGQVAKRH